MFKRTKKILIVEDEPDIADGLDARLGLASFQVIVARNGQEGVVMARSEKPDLIVLDIMMPKIDGYDVCRILRGEEATKNTPILILTALQNVGDVDKAFEVGANDFLTKPFTNERLMTKIEKLLK